MRKPPAPGSEPKSVAPPEGPAPAKSASSELQLDRDVAELRDPMLKDLEARWSGYRISVLNAKGDRGIPEFRVIAGVRAGSVAGDCVASATAAVAGAL